MMKYEELLWGLEFLPRKYRSDFERILEKEYNRDKYFEKKNQAMLNSLVDSINREKPLIDMFRWQCNSEDFKQAVIAIDGIIKAFEPLVSEAMKDGSNTVGLIGHYPLECVSEAHIFNNLKEQRYPKHIRKKYTAMGMFKILAVMSNLLEQLKIQMESGKWQPQERLRVEIEYNPDCKGQNTKFRIYTE